MTLRSIWLNVKANIIRPTIYHESAEIASGSDLGDTGVALFTCSGFHPAFAGLRWLNGSPL